ncbi:diguanylate cyclase [Paraglaciecola sp.]|uniref:sensor domain-containing diguanylate cyclase n=1 Tax=Paraglaciecola sp. TaxID=1920173 RepID=UPI003EF9AA5A
MKQVWSNLILALVGAILYINGALAIQSNELIDQKLTFSVLERNLIVKSSTFQNDIPAKLITQLELADVYVLYNRIDLLNELLNKLEKIDIDQFNQVQKGQLLYFKAYSDYFSGRSNDADSSLLEALTLLKTDQIDGETNNHLLYIQTKVNLLLGLNKAYIQEYDRAIKIATAAIDLAEKNNWQYLQGKGLYYLGDIQYELKNYEAALDLYMRAVMYYKDDEVVDIAVANMAIAQMINIVGDKLEALVLLDKATDSFNTQENIAGLANAYLLKSYFIGKTRPQEALNWLTQSVQIREELGVPIDIANAYVHFSSLLFENGNLKDALKYSQLATDIVKTLEDLASQWDAYANHGILLNENKDYQEAYQYMRKAERALLKQARLDITNETARLSVSFDLKQHQLENIYAERQKVILEERNALLESQIKLQEDMHTTQNWMLIGLAILLVMFLGLILVIYRLYYKTKILASRDGLTGLNNRRTIMSLAEHHFAVSLRYGHALSVIMIDIDRFKMINDQHGHAQGDDTLTAIANILKNMLRASDNIGRIGGEEFLLVLPHTNKQEAFQFAERIRQNVKIQLAQMHHQVKDVTVSLGVASRESNTVDKGNNIQHIIAQADRALYLAKNRGRDQVQTIEVTNSEAVPEV